MKEPVVSVIMAVHNGEQYLSTAIDSMLNQSFTDFEFIIVNDCSKDRTSSILQSIQDPRVIIIENETNLKLAASLNKAIAKAKGKYIARMDDDDIAYPDRLKKQVNYMEAHATVGLLGTYAKLIGDRQGTRKHSSDSATLKVRSLFSCQFCHPTVMLRKKVLEDYGLRYDESFATAQDYELWSRMIKITDFGTVPEILLDYRFHDKQVSQQKRTNQIDSTNKIYQNIFQSLGLQMTETDLAMHHQLASHNFKLSKEDINAIGLYFKKLIDGNNRMNYFPKVAFNAFLSEYYYNILNKSLKNRIQRINCYKKYGFRKYFYPSFGSLKQLLK